MPNYLMHCFLNIWSYGPSRYVDKEVRKRYASQSPVQTRQMS